MTGVSNIKDCDAEETLAHAEKASVIAIVMSTFTDGKPPPEAAWFCTWVREAANDFRYQHSMLQHVRFGVFALGHSDYGDKLFCLAGAELDKNLAALSGQRVLNVGYGDEAGVRSRLTQGGQEAEFDAWAAALLRRLKETSTACNGDGLTEQGASDDSEEDVSGEDEEAGSPSDDDGLVDLEEIGDSMKRMREANGESKRAAKAMITPNLRANLSKQGYKLIGSHSAVKICRWTTAQLRGRGGCYKHTFYGIESHRCMEATPSLACANKCVFCWRHHTNPVGTEWKWLMDEPDKVKILCDSCYKCGSVTL